MRTEWDSLYLAEAYLEWPICSEVTLEAGLSIFGVKKKYKVCEI